MSRAKVVAGVSGVVALASLICMAVVASQPPVYSGDPSAHVAQINWVTLLGMLFSGSTVATISAIWTAIRPFVRSVTPTSIPLPSENIESTVEFLAAGAAYVKNRDDAGCQLRFALSSLVEIGNIPAMKTEAIQTQLRELTVAIAAQQFPVTE